MPASLLSAFLNARACPDAAALVEAATGAPPPAEHAPAPPSATALLAQLEAAVTARGRAQILTPLPVARWLAAAALPAPCAVLDLAAGTGRLLMAALDRLVALGRDPSDALGDLAGVELDPRMVSIARCALIARAAELGARRLSVPAVHVGDGLGVAALPRAGAVLLNPPYAGGDQLSAAQHAALARLPFHRRQLDQAVFFLGAGLEALEPGGTLAAITPRYWLEATGASSFRAWLAAQAAVVSVFDLGDVQVWPAVNVLTALVVLHRSPEGAPVAPTQFLRATSAGQVDALLAGHPTTTFPVARAALGESPWTFRPPAQEGVIGRLTARATPVSAWFEVGQGVKTGCNEVFVVDADTARRLDLPEALVRPTARTRDLRPFAIADHGDRLLLVLNDTDLDAWPALAAHLEPHRARLLERYQVRANVARWFALSLPQNLRLMQRAPKIVTPLYARANSFAVDRDQRVLRTDAYVLAPRAGLPVPIEAVVAALNSAPVQTFVRARAKLKRDGYVEYGRRLLDQLPLPWTADGAPLSGEAGHTAGLAALGAELEQGVTAEGLARLDALVWAAFGQPTGV